MQPKPGSRIAPVRAGASSACGDDADGKLDLPQQREKALPPASGRRVDEMAPQSKGIAFQGCVAVLNIRMFHSQ